MNKQDRMYPQERVVKVLVGLIKSHQALLGVLKATTNVVDCSAADDAAKAAGSLLSDIRLGEVKVENWVVPTTFWCIECGNNWEGDPEVEDCPECGGQCSDV